MGRLNTNIQDNTYYSKLSCVSFSLVPDTCTKVTHLLLRIVKKTYFLIHNCKKCFF